MKSSDMIEDKDKPISITKNNSEESITPLDMMPVSTTKKSDNNKKKPKKMKIIEKEDIEDNKEEEELQQSLKDQNETIKDMENKTTSLPTPSQSETESKKGNEFLNCSNNKSAILSSFILNKEDEKSQEKEKTEEVKDELKPKLNNKRSIIIEEVDKTESIKPVSELPVEKIKEDKSSSIIEIIEKEESPKVQIIEEIKDEENSSSKIQVIEDEKESKKEAVIEVPEENTNIEKPPKKVRPKVNVATTMYDFERDWKSMRNDDQKTFEYLSSIIPENLPNLFKNSLESDYLTRMLVIVKKFYINESMFDEIYALFNSLQKVNRFDMTLMFMSRKDKQMLKDIFDALKSNQANSSYSMADLDSLSKKYKIIS